MGTSAYVYYDDGYQQPNATAYMNQPQYQAQASQYAHSQQYGQQPQYYQQQQTPPFPQPQPYTQPTQVPQQTNPQYPHPTQYPSYQSQYQSQPPPQAQSRPQLDNRIATSTSRLISPEEDVKRLFNVCKTGRGNASLLHEALVYAKPEDLKEKGLIQEFLGRCRASQDLIFSQITWATSEAERSRRSAHSSAETTEEKLLAELLGANEELLEAIKIFDDLERVGIEQVAQERTESERKLRALTAITSFEPTPSESALVDQIFDLADTQCIDAISGHAAAKIFSGSKLSPRTLADIWLIANVEENPTLSRQCVGVALRLIGHAQKSPKSKVDEGWVGKAGPSAVIEGLEPAGHSSPSNVAGSSFGYFPPLTSQDRSKFMKIFFDNGPKNGVLNGGRARDLFIKSRLPLDKLAQIWDLADAQHRGVLDFTSFTIAMYLIQAIMSGQLKSLPSSLPPSIYHEASLKAPFPTVSSTNGGNVHASGSTSPLSPRSSAFSSSQPRAESSRAPRMWDVSPELKATADEFFDVLDEQRRGYLDGPITRAHFIQTGLSEDVWRQVWRLVDLDGDGRLSRDEFAVAMYLIQMKESGQTLPRTLPDSLIPPALRPGSSTTSNGSSQAASGSGQHANDLLIDLSDSVQIPSVPPILPISPQSPSSSTVPPLPPRHSPSHLNAPSPTHSLPRHRSHQPSISGRSSPGATLRARSVSAPIAGPSTNQPLPSTPANWNWDVTPAQKVSSDRFFDMLDPWKQGYIEGEAAVPFMSKSKLSESVLAQIWDLADADTDGRLSRDDFAVAMHLIRGKLAGKDIPATLPPSLVPPSARPGYVAPASSEPPETIQTVTEEQTPQEGSSTGNDRVDNERSSNADVVLSDDVQRSQTPPPPYSENITPVE